MSLLSGVIEMTTTQCRAMIAIEMSRAVFVIVMSRAVFVVEMSRADVVLFTLNNLCAQHCEQR